MGALSAQMMPLALASLALLPGARCRRDVFQAVKVPWPEDAKFKETDRRHKWCDVDKEIVETMEAKKSPGGLSFRHGLENTTMSVVFLNSPQYMDYDAASGTLQGGFFPEVLEEAAKRSGFQWRTHFAMSSPPNASNKETFDGWMKWAVDNYDLVVGDFSGTEERRASGFKFAFPILDESPVLVTVYSEAKPTWYETAFSFLRPFSYNLWFTILLGVFSTACVYFSLEMEFDDFKSLSGNGHKNRLARLHSVAHSTWLAMVSVTGGGAFSPHTGLGKLISLSWTFLVLIVIAAYTANLASLLVVEGKPASPITGIQDAINRNIPVCVYKGGAFDAMIQERYPELPLKYPRVWGYDNVRTGNCGAIVKDRFDFEIDLGRKEYNPKCDLGVVGSPIVKVSGSFVTKADSSMYCTSMVNEILSVALHDMYNDGWLAEAKLRLEARSHDQSCSSTTGGSKASDTSALSIENFAGIFGIHFIVSAVSLLILAVKGRTKSPSDRAILSEPGDMVSPRQESARDAETPLMSVSQ